MGGSAAAFQTQQHSLPSNKTRQKSKKTRGNKNGDPREPPFSIFLIVRYRTHQPRGLLNRRNLNALLSTKMLDSAIAPAARTGDSKVPVKG